MHEMSECTKEGKSMSKLFVYFANHIKKCETKTLTLSWSIILVNKISHFITSSVLATMARLQ